MSVREGTEETISGEEKFRLGVPASNIEIEELEEPIEFKGGRRVSGENPLVELSNRVGEEDVGEERHP